MQKPEVYGRYLLIDRVSVGGMAEVFKAMTVGLSGFQKILAIKRVLPNIAAEEGFIKMFVDEANIAGILHHANIAQIYDLGAIDDSFFIAMEYVEGRDLRAIFDKIKKLQRPLPPEMSAFICARILSGLDYAHHKLDASNRPLNIVHRDVSPPNILVSYDGDVKLIDFGIAKAAKKVSKTQAGVLKGKFGYMSPEQVRGMSVDGRSDVFSVGIVLWEMLAHKRLFVGETDFQTLEKVRGMEITPPSRIRPEVPGGLDTIVMKALERDVKRRYASAGEMAHELKRLLYNQQEVFTERSLSNWMREVFADEVTTNKARMEEIEKIDFSLMGIDLEAMREAKVTSLRRDEVQATPSDEDHEPVQAADAPALSEPTPPPAAALPAGDSPAEEAPYDDMAAPGSSLRPLVLSLLALLAMLATLGWYGLEQIPRQVHAVGANGKTGQVTFLSNRPGADVVVNDRNLCTTPCRITDFWSGEHVVTFRLAGFTPDSHTFTLNPGEAIEVVGKLYTDGDIPAGLSLRSDPPGATVWINGERQDAVTPVVLDTLKAGLPYTVKLEKSGYSASEKRVTLEAETVESLELSLAPETPSLRIESTPPGASIFLDGQNTRLLTPARLTKLEQGSSYLIRLELEDHVASQFQATARRDKEPAFRVELEPGPALLRAREEEKPFGWLTVHSEPVTRISINGRATGRSTPYSFRLAPGSYRIRLESNQDKIDHSTELEVSAGTTHEIRKEF